VGKRRPEDVKSSPLATLLPRYDMAFQQGTVTKLDPEEQFVTLENDDRLDYDFLVIATGPKLAFDTIPGGNIDGDDATLQSVCTTHHATHVAEAVERLAANPGPVVVGAAQGASCFSLAYEFAFLLHNALKQRGGSALLKKCQPFTLITSEPYVGHLSFQGAGDPSPFYKSWNTTWKRFPIVVSPN